MNLKPGIFPSAAALAIGCFAAAHAQPLPYTSDANTLILYHLDEADGSAVTNSAASGGLHGVFSVAPGTSASAAAIVLHSSHPRFGNALVNAANQGVGVDVNGNGTWNFDGIEAGDRFAMSQLGSQFTLEAMVNLASLSAGNQHIWGGDGNTQRAFQFRIENGGILRFDPDPGGTSVSFDLSTITGTHAFEPDQWFHVAVTYDATGGAGTERVRFYWTRVDSGAKTANLVHTGAAGAVTFNGTLSAPLVLGNEGRSSALGETLFGRIDEARVSKVARAADDFIFRNVIVSASSGNWEVANPPANTLDGDLATRASSAGDGASITYQISGTPVALDSIGMAFFNGDSRVYLFDVLVSTDNVEWSTALSGATSGGNSLALETFDLPGDPVASFVRIVGHGHNGDIDAFNSYTEFVINPSNEVVVDGDGDGLPDEWEIANFGTLAYNSYDDPDGDGYTNIEEFVAGTSPAEIMDHPLWESPRVEPLLDTSPTNNARLFASNATYGRAINGITYQQQILLTHDGFQYTAWYDNTTLTVFLARRTVDGDATGGWEVVDTGSTFVNGVNGDAHNVISLGICETDGTLHMSWDHHGHTLRYRVSVAGLCTTNKAAWGAGMLNAERNWLVSSGQSVPLVTYPLFVNTPGGGLVFQWRYGSSGSGANRISAYNPATGVWSAPIEFDTGSGTYVEGSYSSTSRNAYLNGVDFGPDGKMHITWTYREGAGTSNHDLCYAYSPDLGGTWYNNSGVPIADTTQGQRIGLNSPGIRIKRMNMNQLLINQQTQCVDPDGRVHMLMLHRREDPGYEYPNQTTALFSIIGTAYYHYFRDPETGAWAQRRIPPDIAPVGSRPTMGCDAAGNLYAVYLTYTDRSQVYPGYRGGYLAIATASKDSSYSNWRVVHTSTTKFNGEPLLDQARLEQDGILSVFIQEDSAVTTAVGTPLHVIDFAVEPVTDPDSDNDGLLDLWEMLHFKNLDQTATGDPDEDGFDNITEQAHRTDPTDDRSMPGDADGDGLNDEWEIARFGSIAAQDGDGDPDHDYATNAREFHHGVSSTDPNDAGSWPDIDGDGLNDGWEIHHFGNLATGDVDSDGDGALNSGEMAAGSDPNDPDSRPTKARLAHRWSFNGSLADSVGGSDAVIVDVGNNNATLGANSVTMAGGAKASSDYVKLGSGLIGGRTTPVSIELWATQNQVQNWSRIFDFNLDTTEYLFMSWSVGTNGNVDRVAWKQAPGTEAAPANGSNSPYALGVPYHIVLTITPAVNTRGELAAGSRVTVYSAPAGSASLGPARATFDTTYHLAHLDDLVNALGWSPWADNTASATYDEVRIWEGALTLTERELYHSDGPDLIRDPDDLDGDGLRDAWEIAMFGGTAAQNGADDADHDGTDNRTEQRLGLDPNDSTSRFAAVLNGSELSWPGAYGLDFSIQRSTDVVSWTTIAVRAGTAGINTFVDPDPPEGRAFYRVTFAH